MTYVEGFVAAVATANKQAYLDHAIRAAALFREHGATRSVEAWEDDVKDGHTTDFRRAVDSRDGESIVFAWLEFPDRATRDAAMEKIMADPRMTDMDMPFDGQRMVFGGFSLIVDQGSGGRPGYVDGFLVPVPTTRQQAYRDMAIQACTVFGDHGVTRLVEGWGEDVPRGKLTDLYRAVQAHDDETVVFSWCEWPSAEARHAGQAALMADERMTQMPDPMPFDGRRMVMGGFSVILDA